MSLIWIRIWKQTQSYPQEYLWVLDFSQTSGHQLYDTKIIHNIVSHIYNQINVYAHVIVHTQNSTDYDPIITTILEVAAPHCFTFLNVHDNILTGFPQCNKLYTNNHNTHRPVSIPNDFYIHTHKHSPGRTHACAHKQKHAQVLTSARFDKRQKVV